MRWIRSYPVGFRVEGAPKRTWVDDAFTERLMTSNYDYTPLGKLNDDILLIEWDIAASKEDKELFEAHARQAPDKVLVAPHKLYHMSQVPVWAHRVVAGSGSNAGIERWIETGEPYCDLFAFGMIYLPNRLIQEFLAAPAPERGCPPFVPVANYGDRRFTDQTFSSWHWRTQDMPVKVDWSVRPVHLHY